VAEGGLKIGNGLTWNADAVARYQM